MKQVKIVHCADVHLVAELTTLGISAVTVVDLRQEYHGFINGLPVSWTDTECLFA